MNSNVTSLVVAKPRKSVVPSNPREETRKTFGIPKSESIADLIKSSEFISLQAEYDSETETTSPAKIDLSEFITSPPLVDLRTAHIDYVDQRERLKDVGYRKGIIDIAVNFNVKYAEFPALKVPTDAPKNKQYGYILDWQKRTLALMLRGVYNYPCSQIKTTYGAMSEDFGSQFSKKDRMKEYDKFKAELADGSAKHWAMQACFERLSLSIYPFAPTKPHLTGLSDVTKAMYNSDLHPDEKNKSWDDKQFLNFNRAVAIYRVVYPTQSKNVIMGSWIRGCTAIIASLDDNILKKSDQWIITVFEEAKKASYGLHNDACGKSIAFEEPTNWTGSFNWQGNNAHKNSIISFARAWNTISDAKGKKFLPRLKDDNIKALAQSDAKFLKMELA